MSRKTYEVDDDAVRQFRDSTDDNLGQYLLALYNRSRTMIEDTELPKSAIALELLRSTFPAFTDGQTHETVSTAYPVKAWREDTVEVPAAWLKVLVDGWAAYLDGPTGQSIGEALSLEGGGQGKQTAKRQLEKLNDQQSISNEVSRHYLNALANGEPISWEVACGIAAETLGVSERTAKRASEKFRHRLLWRLDELGILKG